MSTTSTVYRDGVCVQTASTDWPVLADAARSGNLVWIDLEGADGVGFARVAHAFNLHHLAVEDAVTAHQRAKLDVYGDVLFCVMRPAAYDDAAETVVFGELHLFTGPGFIITILHGQGPHIASVRDDLDTRPELLARGSGPALHAVIDRVVDEYAPVAEGIQNDIDEIEDALFSDHGSASDDGTSRRIYQLTREVIGFQRALGPLDGMIAGMMTRCGGDTDEHRYLRDIHDHVLRLLDMVEGYRQLLDNLLHVNLTLETKALSERSHAQDVQMKKVSSWAAIIFAPTLVGTIYGMNFDNMPELHWQYGYLWALFLMVVIAVGLYFIFKRRDWL
ncbi:MAG: magnesium and cobalt transport protein CorA [Thermoleophilia bacterium]